jgi:hypothetical protein
MRYGGAWTHVVLPLYRPLAPIVLLAAIAAPLTAPIALVLLLRYWRMGWLRALCLLAALVGSLLAGIQVWLTVRGLLVWHG